MSVKEWFSKRPIIGWILVVVLSALIPPFVGSYFRYVINLAIIFIIAAYGMNILVGTNQVSIGNAAFFAIGAYTSALLVQKLGVPFLGALLAAGILAAIIGFIIGLPAIRLEDIYLGIATMGFVLICEQILISWSSLTNGANGVTVAKASLGGWPLNTDLKFFYFLFPVAIASIVIGKNISKTRTGRAFAALRMSPIAAQAMGINVAKYKAIAFVLSAFFTGISGSLFAHYVGFIDPPTFSIFLSISFLSMVVIGGMGTITGSILGALFVTIVPEILVMLGAKEAQRVVYGISMILILRFFPQGIQGLLGRTGGK
jgi:branched-chain amino acid transport system permease protein